MFARNPLVQSTLAAMLLCTLVPPSSARGEGKQDPKALLRTAEAARLAGRYRDADSLARLAHAMMLREPPRSARERLLLMDQVVMCARPATVGGVESVLVWATWAADQHDREPPSASRPTAWLAAAQAYRRAGKADSFLVCAERAIVALRAWHRRPKDEEARMLAAVAAQCQSAEKSKDMDRYAREAIETWQRDQLRDSVILATALVPRARARLEQSNLEGARGDLDLALRIRLARNGADDGALVPAWRTRATQRALSGDAPGSVAAIEEAIRTALVAYPENDPELIPIYAQASAISSAAGDLLEATRYGRLAVSASEKRFGTRSAATANAKISLANALSHLGDITGALAEGREAVEIQREVLPGSSAGRAYGLSTLGSIELAAGKIADAYDHYGESARIREELLGPDHMSVLYSLGGKAEAAERLGKLDEARAIQERVARFQDSHGLRKQLLESLTSLARIEARMGDPSRALTTLDRAASLSDSIFGPGAAPAPDPRLMRVVVLRSTGRLREAFDEALAIARAERERIWRAMAGLSEREALGAAETRSSALFAALEIASDPGLGAKDARRAWAELARSRSLVFRYQAERRARRRSDGDPRAYASLDSARAELAREILAGATGAGEVRFARLDSLRHSVEDAERGLDRSGGGLASADEDVLDHALASLGKNERLVSFVRLRLMEADAQIGSGASGDSAQAYVAMVARGAAGTPDVAFVPLGQALLVDERIGRWSALVQRPSHDAAGEKDLERRVREAGDAVRRTIWDPLAKHLKGADRVYVIPDGSVANVDLAALPAASGKYLVETGPRVVALSSERDMAGHARPLEALLAMGSPDFDAPRGQDVIAAAGESKRSGDSATVRFHGLPESAAEAREVCAAWAAAGRDSARSALRLEGSATEREFRREAPPRSIVHVATHGFLVDRASAEWEGGRTRRGVGAVVAGAPEPRLSGAVDWSVAGLALAGSNHPSASPEEDGLLTSAEIASLDLSRVRCAVLSACRTGSARDDQPESIQGLERGFRLAGAGQVVLSLWPVEDADARAWTRAFYGAYLGRGLGAADAARAADLERLREARRSGGDPRPSRWAPFFARGERETHEPLTAGGAR